MPYFVYIIASRKNGTLYIGVTNDLARRAFEHRGGLCDGFSSTHATSKLVYYEAFDDVRYAIQREKTLKRWKRS